MSYIRSFNGYGEECVLVTFDSGIPSIKAGLRFLYHFKYNATTWIHKDIIVLFYVNTSLSIGPKNFLN